MNKLSTIGTLLKKIYRTYNTELLSSLQRKGYTDLRPSFLEVLLYVCEQNGPSIKSIGHACGLKKQTMTSHLKELEKRGYVKRITSEIDKRGQNVFLTEYGQRFKLSLVDSIGELEGIYSNVIGSVELDRIEYQLTNLFNKITKELSR